MGSRNSVDAPDVSLPDEDTGVVNRFCETRFEDLSLEAALHEILNLESEYVIETHAAFIEYAYSDQTSGNYAEDVLYQPCSESQCSWRRRILRT